MRDAEGAIAISPGKRSGSRRLAPPGVAISENEVLDRNGVAAIGFDPAGVGEDVVPGTPGRRCACPGLMAFIPSG
jgi:hypothetical protein